MQHGADKIGEIPERPGVDADRFRACDFFYLGSDGNRPAWYRLNSSRALQRRLLYCRCFLDGALRFRGSSRDLEFVPAHHFLGDGLAALRRPCGAAYQSRVASPNLKNPLATLRLVDFVRCFDSAVHRISSNGPLRSCRYGTVRRLSRPVDLDVPGNPRTCEPPGKTGIQQFRVSLHSGARARCVEGFRAPFVYWIRAGRDVRHHPALVRTRNRKIPGISDRLVSEHFGDSGIFLGGAIQNRRHANRRARHDCLPGCRGNRFRCPSTEKSKRREEL